MDSDTHSTPPDTTITGAFDGKRNPSQRVSLKHMVEKYGQRTIATVEEPCLPLACRH
jgi:hypothetical protein